MRVDEDDLRPQAVNDDELDGVTGGYIQAPIIESPGNRQIDAPI